MDRQIAGRAMTPERRRVVAAWEATERAEMLLPPGHPASWHIRQALMAFAADWQAQAPEDEQPNERPRRA